jgi:hypothetical protein
MKHYPHIPKVLDAFIGRECIGFRKYDGSCIMAEWSRKKGWYKWATRGGHLFDKTHKEFGSATSIYNLGGLEKAINDHYPKCESAIAFFEFLGPHSFAGLHDPGILQVESNDPKELVLFDVNIHKRGIISPYEFIEKFGNLRIAEPIYDGMLTEEFIESVRKNQLSSFPLDEGVVCKGGEGHKIWQAKIKTWDYLKKIQKFFGSSYGKYWE